jgi:hypothetical protein
MINSLSFLFIKYHNQIYCTIIFLINYLSNIGILSFLLKRLMNSIIYYIYFNLYEQYENTLNWNKKFDT